jgi:thiol-disulfide isomerase/thioredoxin
MKSLNTFAVAAAALLVTLPAWTVEQGDTAPPWRGVDFDGRSVEFPALLEGKPTVMVFWATWCNYCKAFMPYLESIQNDYGTDQIKILTVNAKEDGSGGDPADYIGALRFDSIAVSDGDAIAALYEVEYIPGLMVIAPDGTVAFRRAWTELPAGDRVASYWARQVRRALDQLL